MSESTPESEGNTGSGESQTPIGATGQDLREHREALGVSLGEISDSLRIRREFLEALESGDYDALPGRTYAIGFVRSYSKHLGLDADRMVRQFKAEISGERPTAKLDFLTPVVESRVPTGAVVFVAVLLALAFYGLWYFMNARELTVGDVVPEFPARVAGTGALPARGPAPAPAPAPAAAGAQGTPGDAPAAKPQADQRNPDQPQADQQKPDQPQPETTPPSGERQPAPSAPRAEAPAATPPAMTPGGPTQPATSVTRAAPAPAASTPASTAGPKVAAASPAPRAERPVPAQVASAAPAPRIVLRAKSDSWIQVRVEGGALLMTRILREGARYEVPERSGLSLTTGNAGGLDILVDGVAIPPVGPFGAVRRDIALDPERLKAGTANPR